MKSTHGMEMNSLFGLSDYYWESVFPGPSNPDPELGIEDKTLGANMRLMWTKFERTAGKVTWPRLSRSRILS